MRFSCFPIFPFLNLGPISMLESRFLAGVIFYDIRTWTTRSDTTGLDRLEVEKNTAIGRNTAYTHPHGSFSGRKAMPLDPNWKNRSQGPNVKQLISHRFAVLSVPPGGGIGSALAVLTNPVKLKSTMLQATQEIIEALDLVKTSPDNPWGNDDEAIAAELLRRIKQRK
jgi:hypothetical protein